MTVPFRSTCSISRKEDSLPTVTGATTPGKSIRLRRGNTGSISSKGVAKSCAISPSKSAMRENGLVEISFSFMIEIVYVWDKYNIPKWSAKITQTP